MNPQFEGAGFELDKRTVRACTAEHDNRPLAPRPSRERPSSKPKPPPQTPPEKPTEKPADDVAAKRKRASESMEPDAKESLLLCHRLVRSIMKLPEAAAFLTPVDPVLLNIPDYYTVIKTPMDLGTVKTKLEASTPTADGIGYDSAAEVAVDVGQTFANAMTYNPPRHPIHECAAALRAVCDRYHERIAAVEAGAAAADSVEIHTGRIAAEVRRALDDLRKRAAEEPTEARALPVPETEEQRERRMLGERINRLGGRDVSRVVEVVAEASIHLRRSLAAAQLNRDAVVEIDLDALDQTTFAAVSKAVTEMSSSPVVPVDS